MSSKDFRPNKVKDLWFDCVNYHSKWIHLKVHISFYKYDFVESFFSSVYGVLALLSPLLNQTIRYIKVCFHIIGALMYNWAWFIYLFILPYTVNVFMTQDRGSRISSIIKNIKSQKRWMLFWIGNKDKQILVLAGCLLGAGSPAFLV